MIPIMLLALLAASPVQHRVLFDAHNCYPYEGHWSDRIERALSTGVPLAIEQDLAWNGVDSVVSHGGKLIGNEPTLRRHFFERVRPMIEQALKDGDHSQWPLIVLHFDFKDVQPDHLRYIWKLLGEYEGWIATADKTADPSIIAPWQMKPLLVLTEEADEQEQVFFRQIPDGGKLRIFGSAKTPPVRREAPLLPPEEIVSAPPTNYRRWWNNPWAVVERGGQKQAGEWTPEDNARLKDLVNYAHKLGYWIRFYTLDGFAPAESQGWFDTYNFGSREAVMKRWKAAIEAGVDLIATDQYEDFAKVLRESRKKPLRVTGSRSEAVRALLLRPAAARR